MSDSMYEKMLEEALDEVRARFKAIYLLGRKDQAEEMRQGMMRILAVPDAPATAPIVESSVEPQRVADDNGSEGTSKRAPRGLARELIAHVLSAVPGDILGADEVVTRAIAMDSRVNKRGILDELNRGDGTTYVRVMGRWALNVPSGASAMGASVTSHSFDAEDLRSI